MSSLSSLIVVLTLVELLFASPNFPYSRRERIQDTRFTGSRDFNGVDDDEAPDYGPNRRGEDGISDAVRADRLSMIEVNRDGTQHKITRTEEDIQYFRDLISGRGRDISPSRDRRGLADFGTETSIDDPDGITFAQHAGYLRITKAGGSTSRCTGTMIGSKYVLTAAHCLHEGNGGDWFSSFDFKVQNEGSYVNWNRARVFSGWSNNDNTGCNNREYDIGIIELDSNPGYGSAAWGWSNAIAIGDSIGHYSYPATHGTTMQKSEGTIDSTYYEDEAFCSDDTSFAGGSSGGGVYVYDGTPAINGVIVSECSTHNRYCRITSWKKASFDDFMS